MGRVIRVTDNLGQKLAFGYDAEGNQIQQDVVDPDGALATTVTQTFDNLNRLLTITSPHIPSVDSTTQFQYDRSGNPIARIDPNINASSRLYDPGNRLTEVIDALNGSTVLAYDANRKR